MGNTPKLRFEGFTGDWEQYKLGEITDSYSGGTPSAGNKKFYGGSIPFIRSGEISKDCTELFINEDGLKNSSAALVNKGDILYALYGATSGEVSRSKIEGAINQAILAILPHQGYDSEFLMQWLRKEKTNIVKTYLQGGQGNLSGAIVKGLSVNVPAYNEQILIAETLKNADCLITLYQHRCSELTKVKQYYLQNMFPQKQERVPKLRFAGFTDDWDRVRLGDIVERVTRKNDNKESELPLTISSQYGLIDQNDFFDRRIASKDVSNYYLIFNGEFAYNKSSSTDAPWGAVKRLDRYKMGVLSTLYILFRIIDTARTCSDYIVTYYDTNLWHRNIMSIASEGARNHGLLNVTPADFFDMMIVIPKEFREQKSIGDYFASFDSLVSFYQSRVDLLKNIKTIMQRNMFV